MGHRVKTLLAIAILGSVFMAGCKEEVAPVDPNAAVPKAGKGGNEGLATQAPEMMPPEGAPTADQVVGSKAGGG